MAEDARQPFEVLTTIDKDGKPPETRVATAVQAREIFERLVRADNTRSFKRAKVQGLIDGNPPYSQARRRAAGLADKCNINFRVSESYVNNASGAFYDLFTEAPLMGEITCGHGTPEERAEYGRKISKQWDWLLRYEPCFDYEMQISQAEMTIFGGGPLMFQDEFDWRPKHVLYGQLKVPERTQSDTSRWEYATLEIEYTADNLYQFINDPKAAEARGWDVEATRLVIMRAYPQYAQGGMYRQWEWHQQQLKNGSIYYGETSSVIRIVHLFFREFPRKGQPEGKVSHVCIQADRSQDNPNAFLFQKIDQYDSWDQCVHPMYYDRGAGGFHHGVTGMGIKMFSVMELQNRLYCNLADGAMSPKVMFTPTTASQVNDFALVEHSNFGVLAPGWQVNQQAISGQLEEPMAFNRDITGLIASNLSQYRQNIQREQGNPITATEAQQRASEQARLNKTQMNRYYQQLDKLYAEMYRRVVDPAYQASMPGADRAKEFIQRCIDDGVPMEAIRKPELVKAARVIGQGSEFMRQQSLGTIFQTTVGMLPEGGRDNLITDFIASFAGQSAVDRYYPASERRLIASDQEAEAMQWVGLMKMGMDVTVTDSQNPLIYSSTFLAAADQAAQSLSQGAPMEQVAAFLDTVGRNTVPYLQRLSQDPSRKVIFKQLKAKWDELAALHDKLAKMLDERAQAQAEQQAMQQQQMSDQQFEMMLKQRKLEGDQALKAAKTRASIQDKNLKTAASLQDQAVRTRFDLATNDALTAQEIQLTQAEAEARLRSKSSGEA